MAVLGVLFGILPIELTSLYGPTWVLNCRVVTSIFSSWRLDTSARYRCNEGDMLQEADFLWPRRMEGLTSTNVSLSKSMLVGTGHGQKLQDCGKGGVGV